jgi:hypothetical protein
LRVTLDPQHASSDNNESTVVFDFNGGTIEKDVTLDGYLGIYSTTAAPKNYFVENNSMLNAFNYWLSSVFSRTNRERPI